MRTRGVMETGRLTDPARLDAVRATGLIDTPASEVFDDLARLAGRLLKMPLAFVTFVDETRSYWKATIGTGIAADDTVTRANTVQESFCQYVIASDGPIVVEDAASDPLTRDNPSVALMGVRAWAGYPVVSTDGYVLGSFCVVDTAPRAFTDDDLAVLATLAAAASREVALRQAMARAAELVDLTRQGSERATRLALASHRLSESLNAEALLQALTEIVVPELGTWVSIGVRAGVAAPELGVSATGDPDLVKIVAVSHRDAAADEALRESTRTLSLNPADPRGVGRVTGTGIAEFHPCMLPAYAALQRERLGDAPVALIEQDPVLTVPLTSRGRTIGAMTVGVPNSEDHSLLGEVAQRAATALDNALSFAHAQRAVTDLQRSLMPALPESLPGIRVAARYLPAVTGSLAGGDFHQVVRNGDDLVLVLGDVEGHGMTSAARMGQLRAAVATLALQGQDPQTLLTRLAEDTQQILDIGLATLLVGRFTAATGELVLASAGHPPAVFAEPGRVAYLSELPPGPPLGVGPAEFPQQAQTVPAGTVVVLFSDGLVERRGEDLDLGLERLRAAVEASTAGAGEPDPDTIADDLLAAMACTNGGLDDIALLVVATSPRPER